jgi:hypothetical protein
VTGQIGIGVSIPEARPKKIKDNLLAEYGAYLPPAMIGFKQSIPEVIPEPKKIEEIDFKRKVGVPIFAKLPVEEV